MPRGSEVTRTVWFIVFDGLLDTVTFAPLGIQRTLSANGYSFFRVGLPSAQAVLDVGPG